MMKVPGPVGGPGVSDKGRFPMPDKKIVPTPDGLPASQMFEDSLSQLDAALFGALNALSVVEGDARTCLRGQLRRSHFELIVLYRAELADLFERMHHGLGLIVWLAKGSEAA